MPRKPRRVDSQTESRTAVLGRKRNASSQRLDDSRDLPRTRRPNKRRKNTQQNSVVGPDSLRDFVPFSSLHESNFAEGSSMSGLGFGNNRLKSGFRRGVGEGSAAYLRAPDESEEDGEILSDAASHPTVYEIDSTDEEGGIILNVEERTQEPIVISDGEGASDAGNGQQDALPEEAGFGSAVNQSTPISNEKPTQHVVDEDEFNGMSNDSAIGFIIDSTPAKRQLCLRDLNPDQMEEQLKYVFWHLHRDEIDLNRQVRCLHCQDEGHISEQCPEKTCKHCGAFNEHNSFLCPDAQRCSTCRQKGHSDCNNMRNNTIPCDICSKTGHVEQECDMRHSLRFSRARTERLELWISCCYCTSRSHLIGDCTQTRVPTSSTARWSLSSLDPEQITNLSIQKGMDKLEKDAQNRGLRPEGMKIRGRAARHNADADRRDSEDSDDLAGFLHHPPARRDDRRQPPRIPASTQRTTTTTRNDRFDRYDGADVYRPPRNPFYSTDSFGRARSRSPRQEQGRWQSPSTDGGSSYRPVSSWPPSRQSSPPRRLGGPDHSQRPGPGISIQLPTRKGSNPNLANRNNHPYKKRKSKHRGGGPPR